MRRTPLLMVAAMLLSGCAPTPPRSVPVHLSVAVRIAGSGPLGIFDPGAAADPDGKRVWMSYSSVEPSSWPANKRISTRIAHSDDGAGPGPTTAR